MEKENRFIDELKKFEKSDVVVEYYIGSEARKEEGTCIAINYSYQHLILMTKTEKILIKNPLRVSRKRKS